MNQALRTRRNVYLAGALVAAGMAALIFLVSQRVDGPVIDIGVSPVFVLASAATFCILALLYAFSMNQKLADQIIAQAARRETLGADPLTLRTFGRQLSLMGAGLGWSVLTAGYVAVSLTGWYSTFAAFVLMAVIVSGAAGSRVRRLLDYSVQSKGLE